MSQGNKITACLKQAPMATLHLLKQFVLVGAILVFVVSGSQARVETPEETEKILAFLDTEKCQIIRDAMGEKKLSVTESGFTVEATCEDGKPYIFTLDQKIKRLDKKSRP